MIPIDLDYYRRRAAAERECAEKADEYAAAIHSELARLYEALVEQEELLRAHRRA